MYTVSCLPVITLSISSGLVADSRNRAARAQGPRRAGRLLVHRARIVVSELDDHEIAGAHVGEHPVPVTLGDEGAAAAPAARHVHHAQLRFVEQRLQDRAPALLVLGIGFVFRRGRIAGHEQLRNSASRRQRRHLPHSEARKQREKAQDAKMGWTMGLEPTTAEITTRGSTN